MNELKEYLSKNIFRKNGTINGIRVTKLPLECVNTILNFTSFCNDNISIYIRIKYIILPELKEFPKCPICKLNDLIVCRPCELSKTCCNKECTKKLKINSAKSYFINKYGVNSYILTNDFKTKSAKTKIEKYGDSEYVKTDNFKNKSKTKKHKLYGSYTYNNPIKTKETKFILYGNENYVNTAKYKETCLEKYGVNHVMQVPEIFIKQQINSYKTKYYNDALYYNGKYELLFLNEMYNVNLLQYIKNGFTIKYKYKNQDKLYYPDFIFEFNSIKYIIEIKSLWTYDNYGKNIELKNINDSKFNAAKNIKDYIFVVLKTKEEISSFVKSFI